MEPDISIEVTEGDSVFLSVFAKYEMPRKRVNRASLFPRGAAQKLAKDLGDLVKSGLANPFTLFQIVDLIAEDLQQKPAPEAYMGYALYDSDSNIYQKGKHILSKKAANKHEEMKEKLYIPKTGYIETFLVNETNEDVWFDDFMVMSTSSIVVQETHYDPWGLELTGLGFQAEGIKVNKYLYNGGSLLVDELNLGMYWTPNRLYDPAIGRFQGMDKLSDMFTSVSPMIYGFNNPLKFKDPTGLSGDCDGCVDLPAIVVSGTRLPETAPDYSALLNQLTKRSNPVYRNLGLTAQHNGLGQANQLLNRGNSLHFSSDEALRSRNSGYLDGIGAMVSYGITGSVLAVAGSPMLIETLAQSGITSSMVKDLFILPKLSGQARLMSGGLETLSQLGTGTKFRDLDYFDIATQSIFGFNTFGSILTGSILDYTPFSRSDGNLAGFSINTGNRGLTNLSTGTVAGLSTDFISNNVKSPGASFVLFLGADMIMKFNANQINKIIND